MTKIQNSKRKFLAWKFRISKLFQISNFKIRISSPGFTLVEIIVAIGIFSVVVSIAVGGFGRALRTQRQAAAIVAANDNVFLAMEQIAREIRTGMIFCSSRGGSSTAGLCNTSSELAFIDGLTGATIQYRLSGGAIERVVNGVPGPITGANVIVERLTFSYSGQDENDGLQPRVTISLQIRPSAIGSGVLSPIRLQTTISSRQEDT